LTRAAGATTSIASEKRARATPRVPLRCHGTFRLLLRRFAATSKPFGVHNLIASAYLYIFVTSYFFFQALHIQTHLQYTTIFFLAAKYCAADSMLDLEPVGVVGAFKQSSPISP
jgi:hypothetical protein